MIPELTRRAVSFISDVGATRRDHGTPFSYHAEWGVSRTERHPHLWRLRVRGRLGHGADRAGCC